MSYLDVPRLHFSGTFGANPSTINNVYTNYDYTYDPDKTPTVDLQWNPNGSHAFTISAQVTSFVDQSGTVHTSGDPVIGASFASYIPQGGVVAKLVDLDTMQQQVTRLFGLNLQLTLPGSGGAAFQGLFDDAATLVNLWFTRVQAPGVSGDSAAGGAFQSVLLPPDDLTWLDTGGSPLLQQLQSVATSGLSVRLTVFGYVADSRFSTFRSGSILGTIGPYFEGEPSYLPPRLLVPSSPVVLMPDPLAWAPAKVSGRTLTIDLGNSIHDSAVGGPPVSGLNLEAAVLSGGTPTSLGAIDYQTAFQQTAGVVQVPITAEQAGQPLAILFDGTPQLQEPPNGLYVDIDGSSVYMNPGDETIVTLRATAFGNPAPHQQFDLGLVGSPPSDHQFYGNVPASALTFPSSVTTGADGTAQVTLSATNPAGSLPEARVYVGGQLYFIGGSWAAGNVAGSDATTNDGFFVAPLNVKLFESGDAVVNPTWDDVQPVLYKYYYLYTYMAGIVDLSNYAAVKAASTRITNALRLDVDNPASMPVSREMSNFDRNLILGWIRDGCPPGANTVAVVDAAVDDFVDPISGPGVWRA